MSKFNQEEIETIIKEINQVMIKHGLTYSQVKEIATEYHLAYICCRLYAAPVTPYQKGLSEKPFIEVLADHSLRPVK
jgi:hypothetical protein